jgi:hypothetical protein
VREKPVKCGEKRFNSPESLVSNVTENGSGSTARSL